MNLPTRNNNPGDIRDTKTGSFKTYNNPQEGFDALKNDLQVKVSGQSKTGLTPDSTLRQFAYTWTPPSDNNDSNAYSRNLAKKLGVTEDTPIKALGNRLDDWASSIADLEGYKGQRVSGSSISAAPVQQMQGLLTHEQMIANINAMESQGASKDEVQGYLDSLKNASAQSVDTNQQPDEFSELKKITPQQQEQVPAWEDQLEKASSDLSEGSYMKATGHGLGAVASGVGSLASFGGSDVIGKSLGTNLGFIGKKIQDMVKGTHEADYYDLSQPSVPEVLGAAAKTLPALLGGAALGRAQVAARASALESPTISNILKTRFGAEGVASKRATTGEIAKTLKNTLNEMSYKEAQGAKGTVIKKALQEIEETAVKKPGALQNILKEGATIAKYELAKGLLHRLIGEKNANTLTKVANAAKGFTE